MPSADSCRDCNMLVSQDREGRLYATHPGVQEPWSCPASVDGEHHRGLPENVAPTVHHVHDSDSVRARDKSPGEA